MTGRFFTKFLALSIAMASVLVAVSPMAAEAQARDASDWVVPRTPDPDSGRGQEDRRGA